MSVAVSWPAVVMLGAGAAVLGLVSYFWEYRDRPGGRWWIAVLVTIACYGLSYGTGLFVFDPGVRWLFEIPRFLAGLWAGVVFLGFALAYTGRQHPLRSTAFRGLVAFGAVGSALIVTNPVYQLVWSGYRLDPVFGAATATFVREPGLFLVFGVSWLAIGAAVVLLVDTILQYGPLYRTQALAIAATPVPVGVASMKSLFALGPVPQLDLVPLAFIPLLALDVYALFRGDMFELTPAARRLGERAALTDLATPVTVLDEDRQVVDLNETATDLFDVEKRTALGRRLDALLDADVDLSRDAQSVSVRTAGERREFDVTTSPVEGIDGACVGYTVVFHDVTESRQRKQRLEVLNRVLRHNLRNDLTVIAGFAEVVDDACDDPRAELAAEKIRRKGERLADMSEKTDRASNLLDRADRERVFAVRDRLDDLAADLEAAYSAGTVTVDVPPDVRLRTDPAVVVAIFENLLENALEHHDGEHPRAEVALVDASGHSAVFEVRDDGPGIPRHEWTVVARGEEDSLEHGSGIGLWLVKWGVTSLGGDVSFAVDDRGTTVELRIPGLADDGTPTERTEVSPADRA